VANHELCVFLRKAPYRLIESLANSEQLGSKRQAAQEVTNSTMDSGKHRKIARAHASLDGYEATTGGVGAMTATPLSTPQRVARSNPFWGRPPGNVQ
jgi:hypothetical protein